MAIHKLVRTQLINSTIDELWNFFSNPANLSVITPSYMNFRITSPDEGRGLYAGQIITYKVSPLLGIPMSWMTEITHVVHHSYFVDEQKRGPYRLWHHKHFFEQLDDGVLMTDMVHYQLPMFGLGDIAHFIFIKRQLDNIFDYRYQKIENIFNKR
jgi:ligand-binding SRPBCC domain-containing protein